MLWLNTANLLVEGTVQVLSLSQIPVTKVLSSEAPALIVRLLDGSSLNMALTWQKLGFISIAVFGLLTVFLVFPLEGSIWLKIGWLELGYIIGLAWSFIRLCVLILVAYHFGVGASKLTEFSTTPFLDFFWVVSIWAVAVSTLTSHRSKG